uniref:Endoplasmic reticulum-Golgi intermediate compartment protein n=1 Tax=Coccidioides posadasii RMSCC 3488 TaxID=454284 RepID=A0A0J6FBH7_COCPO|nr:endoplasmic reticulum-Golgi intermediate compartment protein 3 [Coccidioides posadasii RMSCC 3488]
MPVKSRFTRLDAFAKTVEDARIRTRSGGVVTIVSLIVVILLVWGEWRDYRRVVVLPELIVDKGRGERMEIHLNITFPHLPYQAPLHLDPGYCGSCYDGIPPPNAKKPGCCNTCDEVREAYALRNWAFGRGEGVEQCEQEGYGSKIDSQRNEGCRLEGILRVNKVVGNFHVAPGRSFTNGYMHAHDLKTYYETPVKHTMSHIIHQLRFGPQLPDELSQKWKWTDHHHTNPLDSTSQTTEDPKFNFMYFVKVVSTSYLPLGWDASLSSEVHSRLSSDAPLGKQGIQLGQYGSIETHQYSVTSHKRSIEGGDDSAEGHKERVHTAGGIPGVFFNYDISPMKVINREARTKSLSGFLTGVCAVIGGTLTVAAAVDRALYEGSVRVKKLHKS